MTACLERRNRFAYHGDGYRKGATMHERDTVLTFYEDSWDSPEEDYSQSETAQEDEGPAAIAGDEVGRASRPALDEQWQKTHWIPAPVWAGVGYDGIRADMARRAAETEWTHEEVTLYCPSQRLAPPQHLRAHLDPLLLGTRVNVVCPTDYTEWQPILAHALPRFQRNQLDNFNVLVPVAEWLQGYWTMAHYIPEWRGEVANDISWQETHPRNIIIGYAARATRTITTHEYRAPVGLNNGLEELYDEVMSYLSPPMLEDVATLLGDFVTLYEERNVSRAWIQGLEHRATLLQGEVAVAGSLHRVESAGTFQDLRQAREER